MKIAVVLCALAVATAVPRSHAGEIGRGAYVFALDGTSHATNVDLDELLRIRKERTGDFLWFRKGRQVYLVTDAAVLAAGRDILRPLWDLSREQEAVSARLRPFEEREDDLEREEDQLEKRAERLEGRDDRAANEERERLEPLERALNEKQRALAEDMSEIEAEERKLEDRERELERVADALVKRLIEDALRQGLARPVR
jgi:DNA repair exonuclease SbcCD ATPase subunit